MVACVASSLLMAALSSRYLRPTISPATIAYYSASSAVMYLAVTGIETGHHWTNVAAKVPLGVAIIAVAVLVREREIRSHVWRIVRGVSGKPV